MAKEIGAFEKQGLKADLVYISSGSVTVQAMVGGNLDMSVAASNAVVSSILRGAPLVAVGSITNRPAMSLFVQPEITKPEQLQGKVLAITRHGSSTHFLTVFVLEKLGLQDKVKIQPMGGTREVDAAIRTGMVWVNCYKRVHPGSPFGGVGESGYGREMGFDVMREYTQAKSVWINVDAKIPPFYPR